MKTRTEHITAAHTFRADALSLLHRMKDFNRNLHVASSGAIESPADDVTDVQRQHQLSTDALEECVLRQNLVLRSIDADEEPLEPLPVVRPAESEPEAPPAPEEPGTLSE